MLPDVDRHVVEGLIEPEHLWERSEMLGRHSPVPGRSGVYCWYFDGLHLPCDTSKCPSRNGYRLLYVGIAPSGDDSSQNLRKRIRNHFDALGIQLRRTTSGNRMTFGMGEEMLSDWMATHARVAWSELEKPWLIEYELIRVLHVPLNLAGNGSHPFYHKLSALRRHTKEMARAMDAVAGRQKGPGPS